MVDHNDVTISAFPEGQYLGPNYFHNSNEKSGKRYAQILITQHYLLSVTFLTF